MLLPDIQRTLMQVQVSNCLTAFISCASDVGFSYCSHD